MHRIVEIETGQIDGDRIGNGVGRGPELNRVQHEIDRAALLDAGRKFLVLDVNRGGDAHARSGLEAQKIDMQRLVGDDIELIIARQNALFLARNVEFENRREKMPGVDQLVDFLIINRDRLRRLAAAIDYTRYAALATNRTGGPLAAPTARHGRELLDRRHVEHSL